MLDHRFLVIRPAASSRKGTETHSMKKVLLVRHADIDLPPAGADPPLNAAGQLRAVELARSAQISRRHRDSHVEFHPYQTDGRPALGPVRHPSSGSPCPNGSRGTSPVRLVRRAGGHRRPQQHRPDDDGSPRGARSATRDWRTGIRQSLRGRPGRIRRERGNGPPALRHDTRLTSGRHPANRYAHDPSGSTAQK